MLPWPVLALKVAATALMLAIALPLIGFAFTRDSTSGLRALRTGAVILGIVAVAAAVAVAVGEVWR
jgi:hypothetical protein